MNGDPRSRPGRRWLFNMRPLWQKKRSKIMHIFLTADEEKPWVEGISRIFPAADFADIAFSNQLVHFVAVCFGGCQVLVELVLDACNLGITALMSDRSGGH